MRHLTTLLLILTLAACQAGGAATEEPAQPVESQAEVSQAQSSKPELPRTIGQGAVLSLAEERDPERYTVFDFTSEYCGPCRQISPYMDKLHEGREDVAVVKVDINRPGVRGIDWTSPTVRQFGINQLPHMKIMQADGTLIAEGQPAWVMVVQWINELLVEEQKQSQG